MSITGPLVLPADTVIAKVTELPEPTRGKLESEPGDYAVTRPRVRAPTTIVDAESAALLREFARPSTVAEAVLRFSAPRRVDPAAALRDAFPLLKRLVDTQVLLPAEDDADVRVVQSLAIGDREGGYTVLALVSLLEDTEIYQVRVGGGGVGALKIARPARASVLGFLFAREAAVYAHLDGRVNPRCLDSGTLAGRPFLVTAWCDGHPAPVIADEARALGGAGAHASLLALAIAVAEAYAVLHEQGVIHSDVHPGNVLVDAHGAVKLIDYGYARIGADASAAAAPRAGVGFFYEPEFARALLAHDDPPPSTFAGEQYAVAALVYRLFSGAYYLDFSLESAAMMRQISAEPPLSFGAHGLEPWPEVESVLARALAKDPAARFASMREFSAALRAVAVPPSPARAAHGHDRVLREVLDGVIARASPGGELWEKGFAPPRASVNLGAAGLAYVLYRLACVRDDPELLSLADMWVARARRAGRDDEGFYSAELELTEAVAGRASAHHTPSGIHCVQALVSLALGDLGAAALSVRSFVACAAERCDNPDVTLGRAGLLIAAALLVEANPSVHLDDFGAREMAWLSTKLSGYAAVGQSPEVSYLGIAHGWGGIIYAILRYCQAVSAAVPPAAPQRLEELAGLAEPWGRGVRFRRVLSPDIMPAPGDYVPSWCNGAAGLVHLFTLAHEVLGEPRWLDLAERCAWTAWEHADGHGDLCCGMAGRAYALLNFQRASGERVWIGRAADLAARAAVSIQHRTLRRDSLYKGDLGVALLAADLERPEVAAMPFFEHEGWPRRPNDRAR